MKVEVNQYGNRVIYDDGQLSLWGPKYQKRVEKQFGESFLSCIVCARDTSKQGHSKGVVVGGGGSYIVQTNFNEEEYKDAGWMGWFPVGSECIKVVPIEFRFANPYDDKVKGTGGWGGH